MGITRIIKKPVVVEIIFAIASVRGHCPVIGFTEEVEKAWEQLKRKHCIKQRKVKSLQKVASTSQVLNSNPNDSCSFPTFPDEHHVNNKLSKKPQKSNTFSDIGQVFNKFKNLEALEIKGKKDDVYSKDWTPTKYSKMDEGYGRPKPGTLSEARAKKASKHIAREMLQLCEVIQDYGKPGTSGKVEITFKDLFNVYTYISDKKDDVYSKDWVPTKYSKMDEGYGRPKPGTLSEARAKKASKHIAREMLQLCEVIQDYGKPGTSGKVEITFKDLFNVYTYISDKVVGILLRARKHNMVTFEGEMLFQRRDDHVIITLLLTQDDIKTALITAENHE
uniref:Costars domain-containing protein n=1 Tax=Panagrolaimus sp. JU765 TaxID=591449 RepID=A0AC34RPR3_9BILA